MAANVLITACGAKVSLVRAFKKAVVAYGGTVTAADHSPLSPALFEAHDHALLPSWDALDFKSQLLKLCQDKKIRLLVPTADRELPYLFSLKEGFKECGVRLLLPSQEVLRLCQDKKAFIGFCQEQGFPVLPDSDQPDAFPVFVRPRFGQGSVGAMRVGSPEMFQALLGEMAEVVVQDYVSDTEYSIDLLMDLEPGRALQAVARQRLVQRGGEAQVSRVEDVPELTEMCLRLGEAMGLVGHNVVQAFYSPENGVRFIEVNPRFGGASSLSIQAGLDSPSRLLALASGEASARDPQPINYGLALLRYGEDRFVS